MTKKRLLIIDSLILTALLVASILAFPFFSKSILNYVSAKSGELFSTIKDNTGLVISYQSLSPSILSKISLNNVTICDEDGEKLAKFEKILVQYRISKILTGNFSDAIRNITVRDGFIRYDTQKKIPQLEQLFERLKSDSGQQNDTKNKTITLTDFDLKIQNIVLTLIHKDISGRLEIAHANIRSDKDQLNYKLRSHFSLNKAGSDINKNGFNTIGFDFSSNGNIKTDFSTVSAVTNFAGLAVDNITVSPFSFFVSMYNNTVSVSSFQRNGSVDFNALYDLKEKHGNLSINFDKFRVADLIRVKNSNINLQDFATTGFATADFVAAERLRVNWNTDIQVTNHLLKLSSFKMRNLMLQLQASGTEQQLWVKKLRVNSDVAAAELAGLYNIATKQISAQGALQRLMINNQNISATLAVKNTGATYYATISDLLIGNAALNTISVSAALLNKRIDFLAAIKDAVGSYTIDASYMMGTDPFIEAHAVLNAISIQNVYNAACVFMPKLSSAFLKKQLAPFRATSEIYFTSNMKSFSYNVVQFILASTENGGLYALSSFDGSNTSFNLENLKLNIFEKEIILKLNANFAENKDTFFDSLISFDGISYSATGIIADDMLDIYGDYGFALSAYTENKKLKGSLKMQEAPVPLLPFVLSTDVSFEVADEQHWHVVFNDASFVYAKNSVIDAANLKQFYIKLQGTAEPKNIFISQLTIGNKTQSLSGQVSFDSITAAVNSVKQFSIIAKLQNETESMGVDLNSNISISDEVFLDGRCNINNLSLALFSNKQANDDIVQGNITFLGSLKNILLQVNLQKLKMHVKNKPLEASCMFLIDDGTVRIPDANISWNNHTISSVDVNFRPESGRGNLSLKYAGDIGGKEMAADVDTTIVGQKVDAQDSTMSSIEKVLSVINSFELTTTIKNAVFESEKIEQPFTFSVVRDNDVITVYDSKNTLHGFYMNDGTVSLQMDDSYKTRLSFDGSVTKKNIDLQCYNIRLDIPQLLALVPFEQYIKFTQGCIEGDLLINGKRSEPQFFGTLYLDDASFCSPRYAPDMVAADNVPIIFSEYSLQIPRVNFPAKNFVIWAEAQSEFDGWMPAETTIACGIDKSKPGHIKTKNLLFSADGEAACELLMKFSPGAMDLQGWASFDNGSFAIGFDTFDDYLASLTGDFVFTMDLNLILGNRSEYNFPTMKTPILRTLAITQQPILLHCAPHEFTVTGMANMRGGEVTFIKRNFYIKEGNMKFLDTIDGFTPLITLRAEIRERDIDGKPCKLILNLQDQPLIGSTDNWISKITCEPAKSESEILQMIGQIVVRTANTDTLLKDTLTNATDLATQLTFANDFENRVRNFLRLDVLSLRTQVVQNVIFGNLFKGKNQTELTMGDYLDNTSLYFGKYFGSAIYADAALHLNSYDPIKDQGIQKTVYKNILFEPEFGMEMATPFFNIRWSLAPTNPNTLFVSNTSLTFSWSFSF